MKSRTKGEAMAAQVNCELGKYTAILALWKKSKDIRKRLAVKLCQCADHFAMSPRDLPEFPHLLDRYELDPADVTPGVISMAVSLDQQHGEYLNQALAIVNEMAALVKQLQKSKAVPIAPAIDSKLIFGFHPLAVVRWMGAEGWELSTAKRVIRKLGAECSLSKIKKHLEAGAASDADFKPPAALTETQQNEIYEYFEK